MCNINDLKTVDTIGNCQRPVFSLGVSQHMHNMTNLWKFERHRWPKLRDINNGRKNPFVTQKCVLSDFRCLILDLQIKFWGLEIKSKFISVENYIFLEKYVTSEGAVSHNVLYYQHLSITRYQVSFYVNHYFK